MATMRECVQKEKVVGIAVCSLGTELSSIAWRAMSLPGCGLDHMILLHFTLELATLEGFETQLTPLQLFGRRSWREAKLRGLCDDLIKRIVSKSRERGSAPNVSIISGSTTGSVIVRFRVLIAFCLAARAQ